jgi:trehalose 6-phosphate synthase/phosphatase
MANHPYDFTLSMGDDLTDEDLFSILPPTAFSIKVGLSRAYGSRALYCTQSYKEALELLRGLSESELETR